ncbi:MAG: Gfo/Idh/MocA family protein, partial [Candidatus Binatia bacterium]
MKKLRGAIVGFGNVASEAHLPGFAQTKGFEIVAVVDPSEERRNAARSLLPEARIYENVEQLAGAEAKLEFLDIATPPRFHARLAIEALERGYHVLCEKPLTLNASEMGDVRRVVRRIHRSVFTVHNWKYAPLFRRLRGLIVAGTVGEPNEIEWSIERPNPPGAATAEGEGWRLDPEVAGGGILMDHGWHAFYLMRFLVGEAPRSVSADLRHERGLAVEDGADCTVAFGSCTARI